MQWLLNFPSSFLYRISAQVIWRAFHLNTICLRVSQDRNGETNSQDHWHMFHLIYLFSGVNVCIRLLGLFVDSRQLFLECVRRTKTSLGHQMLTTRVGGNSTKAEYTMTWLFWDEFTTRWLHGQQKHSYIYTVYKHGQGKCTPTSKSQSLLLSACSHKNQLQYVFVLITRKKDKHDDSYAGQTSIW